MQEHSGTFPCVLTISSRQNVKGEDVMYLLPVAPRNVLSEALSVLVAHYSVVADDPSLLPCPQTFLQATADRGRFTMDEYCNPKVEDGCVIYHPGAKHCFRTITPR